MLHKVSSDPIVDKVLKQNAALGRYISKSSNINRMICKQIFKYRYGRSVHKLANIAK